MNLFRLLTDIRELPSIPHLDIDLDHQGIDGNEPFYLEGITEFYLSAGKYHPLFPLISRLKYGVAVNPLPGDYQAYLPI